jgi:lipid II:glycine glycyltransferase (peptidoglycan interpeptide bridge formation enzyme)
MIGFPLTFALQPHYQPLPTLRTMVRSTSRLIAGAAMHDETGDAEPSAREPQRCEEVLVTVSAEPDEATLREWDRLVATTAGTDVAQMSAWAGVRRQAGFTPIFVLAHSAGRTVGGALVLQRRLPGLGGLGYVPYGPVLSIYAPRAATEAALCHALAHLGGRQLRALFVQPPRGDDAISRRLLELGFRPSTAGIAPTASLELDLSVPPEILRTGLSSGTRGSIRRASSCGVRVRMAAEHGLPVVAELLAETAAHHRFPPLSLAYLRALYQQLDPGNHIMIFIAEHDGVPVATQVLARCGGVARLRLTGMRRADAARTGAPALLQWETILGARANGYGTFDFGGISASAVDAIRAGRADLASRVNSRDYFKASFGGRPFHYPPPVELFSSKAARVLYDVARRSELGRHVIRRTQHLLRSGGAAR